MSTSAGGPSLEESPSGELPSREGTARAEERAAAVPRPALPPERRRRWRFAADASPRARLAFGLALVTVLAAAWVVVGHGAADDPSARTDRAAPRVPTSRVPTSRAPTSRVPTSRAPTSGLQATTAPRVDAVVAVPRWVPAGVAATCRAHGSSPSRVVVECTPGRGVVRLRYRAFASLADLRAAYAVEGTHRGGSGPPACAAGTPEERSWSTASSPARPVGRYRCTLVAGSARIVWTSEEALVLGVATRSDTDLRTLYQWWTTVPGPNAPG